LLKAFIRSRNFSWYLLDLLSIESNLFWFVFCFVKAFKNFFSFWLY
jgi:hypothetical protein